MNRQVFCSVAFLTWSICLCGDCQVKSAPQIRDSITGERACSRDDWGLTAEKEFAVLLSSYGYDSLPTRSCRAVDVPWLKEAQIVQFSGVQHTDVFVSLTFIHSNHTSRLWLIPVNGGLSKHFDAEDDPHNKAVLNLLLRSARYEPNADQMIDLARLYMFFTAHGKGSDPESLDRALRAGTVSAEVVQKDEFVTVTLHRVTDRLMRGCPEDWVLEFEKNGDAVRLLSVNPERP
jgi:hypothetical protein